MNELVVHPSDGAPGEADARLHGLSLCAGAGGIDLGLAIARPGYRTVCYVEREAYAAATLVARMEDKALDCAPLWDDVGTFDGRPWRGTVDIILGGYPCTPFSVAGKRKGVDDPRHLWPHFARIIGECQPEWVFLENVANHLNLGYREVRGELENLGFGVTEGLFTAAEVGAPHKRQRLYVLARQNQLADAIEKRDIDFAFLSAPTAPDPETVQTEIGKEPLFVIASKDCQGPMKESILLRAYPYIAFSRKTWLGRQIDRSLAEMGIASSPAIELDSIDAIENLVVMGFGTSIVPQRMFAPALSDRMNCVPFEGTNAMRRLVLVSHRHDKRATVRRKIIEILQQDAGGGGAKGRV